MPQKVCGFAAFENLPAVEVRKRGVVGKLLSKSFDSLGIEIEAEKGKIVIAQKNLISGMVNLCSMTLNNRSRHPLML